MLLQHQRWLRLPAEKSKLSSMSFARVSSSVSGLQMVSPLSKTFKNEEKVNTECG